MAHPDSDSPDGRSLLKHTDSTLYFLAGEFVGPGISSFIGL